MFFLKPLVNFKMAVDSVFLMTPTPTAASPVRKSGFTREKKISLCVEIVLFKKKNK